MFTSFIFLFFCWGSVADQTPTDIPEPVWAKMPSAELDIDARSSHCSVVHEEKIYLFGGLYDGYEQNDLVYFDLGDQTWYAMGKDSVSGLYPEPRIGHSCVELENSMLLFGGVGSSFFDEVVVYDFQESAWKYPDVQGDTPPGRSYSSLTVDGSDIYLFGGEDRSGEIDDLWVLHTGDPTWTWEQIQANGTAPTARKSHSADLVVTEFGNKLVITHGYEVTEGPVHQIHMLDLDTREWFQPTIRGNFQQIPERYGHATASIHSEHGIDMVAIYGGKQSGSLFNDMFYMYYECSGTYECTLEYLIPTAANPDSRAKEAYFHTLVSDTHERLYVIGGRDATVSALDNSYQLITLPCPNNCTGSHGICNQTSGECMCEPGYQGDSCSEYHMRWNYVEVNADSNLPGLFQHKMMTVGDKIFMFGGLEDNGAESNNMYIIEETDFPENAVKVTIPDVSGEIPSPRAQVAATLVGSTIYYFGGCVGCHIGVDLPDTWGNSDSEYYNDLYAFDTDSLTWTKVTTSGDGPSVRAASTGTLYHNNEIYYYGGFSGPAARDIKSEVYVLNLADMRWSLFVNSTESDAAPWYGRYGHSANFDYDGEVDRLVVNSGVIPAPIHRKIHEIAHLDMETRQWFRRDLSQEEIKKISKRYYHTSLDYYTSGRGFLIFGGKCNGPVHNDLYLLSSGSITYTKISPTGDLPRERYGHDSALLGSRMFYYGGVNLNDEFNADTELMGYLETIGCPNDCSGKGVCNSGTCECDKDWESADCSSAKIVEDVYVINETIQIVYWVFLSVSLAFLLLLGTILFLNRTTRVVKATSVPFTMLVFGFLITVMLSSSLYSVLPKSDSLCMARPSVTALGLVGLLSCLFAKTYRIHKIFNTRKLSQNKITDGQLFIFVGSMLFVESILLLAWGIADEPAHFQRIDNLKSDEFTLYLVDECTESDTFVALQMTFVAFFLAWGSYLAFKTRDIPSDFNESLYISASIGVLTFASILLIPINYIVGDNTLALVTIRSFGICAVTTFVGAILFGPKAYFCTLSEAEIAKRVIQKQEFSKYGGSSRIGGEGDSGGSASGSRRTSGSTSSRRSTGGGGMVISRDDESGALAKENTRLRNQLAEMTAKMEAMAKTVEMMTLKQGEPSPTTEEPIQLEVRISDPEEEETPSAPTPADGLLVN